MPPSHQVSVPSPLFSTVVLNEGPRLCSRSLRTTTRCVQRAALSSVNTQKAADSTRTFESKPGRLPGPDPLFTKTERRSERYNAYRDKRRNTSDRQKWNDELEDSFQLALRAIPNLGRKKTPCDPRICGKAKGPLYGRNEHIGHFIARQTGVRRSRKQISSHIQVLKYFQKGNAEWMALITKSDPSVLESQPLDVYPPDPIQGPSSSIDSSDPETSVRDYVEVAFPTTPVTNFFLLPSSSCDSYDLSFSESTSYRSSISNSQLSAGCISYRSSYSESFESCSQGCFFQEQRQNCCSHGDYCSAAANRYSRHGPEPTEYRNFGTASYADPDFEIPVHESNSLNVPSFPFTQESYSTSYTTSCAARNNLPAHMAAPPRTRLSAAHNHNTKSQIPFHHFHDPFSKAEHQNWHTQSVEDPLDNEEWQSIEQVAPEQTWANHHPDVDEAKIPAKQGQVLGEIIDVPATTTGSKTLKRELGLQS